MQKIRPDMDIGHNIQQLRKRAHMTQDQVVAHLQLLEIEISIDIRIEDRDQQDEHKGERACSSL